MRWSLVLLVASLTACGDPTAVPQVEVVAKAHGGGSYHLVTWNGRTLPAQFSVGSTCPPDPSQPCITNRVTHITGGDLTVGQSSWVMGWRYRVTWAGDSVTTYTTTGRGDRDGAFLAVFGGGGLSISFAGDTATVRCCMASRGLPVGGEVYVFVR